MQNEKCQLHEENISLKIKGVESHVKALIELNEQAIHYQNRELLKILNQVTLTNGRVTTLEKKTYLWSWLSDKPYRILAAVVVIVAVSRIVTNEMIWQFLLKVFT